MSVDQIKEGIRELSAAQLDQVAALILQLRRANNPDRKDELAEMIDDQDVVPWNSPSAE